MVGELDTVLTRMADSAGLVFAGRPELWREFTVLRDDVPVDRAMALGRARRLLEVVVVDHYIRCRKLTPPYQRRLTGRTLYQLIEDLAEHRQLTRPIVALCHAVRLEGNRAVHYQPDYPSDPKGVTVSAEALALTLQKLLEVAEAVETGGHSLYLASLPPPFGAMYQCLRSEWLP